MCNYNFCPFLFYKSTERTLKEVSNSLVAPIALDKIRKRVIDGLALKSEPLNKKALFQIKTIISDHDIDLYDFFNNLSSNYKKECEGKLWCHSDLINFISCGRFLLDSHLLNSKKCYNVNEKCFSTALSDALGLILNQEREDGTLVYDDVDFECVYEAIEYVARDICEFNRALYEGDLNEIRDVLDSFDIDAGYFFQILSDEYRQVPYDYEIDDDFTISNDATCDFIYNYGLEIEREKVA